MTLLNDNHHAQDVMTADFEHLDEVLETIRTDNVEEEIEELDALIDTLHDAEKSRTLEEQVAYMKERGIDPAKNFKAWDEEE